MRTDERQATSTITLSDVRAMAAERMVAGVKEHPEVIYRPDFSFASQLGAEVVATLSDADVDSIFRRDSDSLDYLRHGLLETVEPRTLLFWDLESRISEEVDEVFDALGREPPVRIAQPDLF